jgi:hypothetical protein
MDEKSLLKRVLQTHVADPNLIRANVLVSSRSGEKKEFFMKRKRIFAVALSIAIVITVSFSTYAAVDIYQYNQAANVLAKIGIDAATLPRSEAKLIGSDIASNSFSNDATKDVLAAKAAELGLTVSSPEVKEYYDAIVDYMGLLPTVHVTSAQVAAILAGTTYKAIIAALGQTKDIGSGLHVLQYVVDGNKILYLSYADENDVCAKSGAELLEGLVDAPQDGLPKNTFHATLTQRDGNRILVSCPTYTFDSISLTITEDTVIQFADGSPATIDDIQWKLTITIGDQILESYPPQGTALKIIIDNG